MKDSKIEWCDHTFNPWEGCTKVSPGCVNCYAENRNKRWAGGVNWGKGAPRRRTSASNWKEPLKWARAAAEESNEFECHKGLHGGFPRYAEPRRPRVFCASLADWLDDEVPLEWLADLMALIAKTPELDWLLLTKRPENWQSRIKESLTKEFFTHDHGEKIDSGPMLVNWLAGNPPANVWIGTSVEDQVRLAARMPTFLHIPARIRFLSCEPLLGDINFAHCYAPWGTFVIPKGIHWIIAGGESGPHARPTDPRWIYNLKAQCFQAGVAFFFKQWGEFAPLLELGGSPDGRNEFTLWADTKNHKFEGHTVWRVGKSTAGRLLGGHEYSQFPK